MPQKVAKSVVNPADCTINETRHNGKINYDINLAGSEVIGHQQHQNWTEKG